MEANLFIALPFITNTPKCKVGSAFGRLLYIHIIKGSANVIPTEMCVRHCGLGTLMPQYFLAAFQCSLAFVGRSIRFQHLAVLRFIPILPLAMTLSM